MRKLYEGIGSGKRKGLKVRYDDIGNKIKGREKFGSSYGLGGW